MCHVTENTLTVEITTNEGQIRTVTLIVPGSDSDSDSKVTGAMRLGSALRSVSVEPMLFLYYVAAAITSYTSYNLILQKICYPDHPTKGEPCAEEEAQKVITSINTWAEPMENGIPVFFILFAGAWSDAHGKRRKPLMILPIMGEIITLFILTSSVFFWRWSPEMTAFLQAVIRGITGGRVCFSLGVVTYISDNTFPAQRTFRMAIITALIFIASPIGNAISGIMRVTFGYYIVFNLCLFLDLFALLSGLLLLKRYSDEVPVEKACGYSEVLKTWRTVSKERAGYKRVTLFLMMLVSPIFGGCLYGEYSVLYLYVRYKFHWGEEDYGFYSAYRMSVTFFGTLLSVWILSRVLQWSDVVIGLMASTMQVVAALGNALAQHPWQMILYPGLDLMHGAIYAVGHSIVSKMVESHELGQVLSVLSTVDSLIPFVVFPLYNQIYQHTFESIPGAFFYISAALASLSWVLFLVTILLSRRERTRIHTTVG